MYTSNALIETNKNDYVTDLFDDFYKELMICRTQAEKDSINDLGPQIWSRMNEFLKSNVISCLEMGGEFVDSTLKESVYIMTALADEVFINLNWSGQAYWKEHLLETAFFGTHVAGEEIFKRIDNFLNNRSALLTDLAVLYLKTLALGFLGQYRNSDNTKIIDSYRKKLYHFIIHGDPSAELIDGKIFKQSYDFTLTGLPRHELPDPKWWYYAFCGFLLVFTASTSWIWSRETHNISQLVEAIVDIATTGEDS